MQRQEEDLNACIARSGISQVLSQARASLKNPSRPFTPRNEARSLFDSRPGSRSGSMQVLPENDLLGNPKRKPTRLAPSSSLIPPKATYKRPSPPASAAPTSDVLTSSLYRRKLPESVSEERDDRDDNAHQHETNQDSSQMEVDHRQDDQKGEEKEEEIVSTELARHIRTMKQLIEENMVCKSETEDSGACVSSSDSQRCSSTLFKHLDDFVRSVRGCAQIHARLDAIDQVVELVLGDYLTKRWVSSGESTTIHAEDTMTLAPLLLELLLDHEEIRRKHEVSRTFTSDQVQRMVALSKMLFTLSKQSDNDLFFCCVRLVESILGILSLHAKSSSDAQSQLPLRMVMYLLASLKNVSIGQDKMIKLLATNGAIRVFSEYMHHAIHELQEEASADSMHSLASTRDSDESSCRKAHAQVVIQVTSILRNLSVKKSHFKQLSESHVVDRMCGLMQVFDAAYDMELVVNIFRILSKLTLHEVFRAQFNDHFARNLRCCMGVFMQKAWFISRDENDRSERSRTARVAYQDTLFVRVGFTLGNLSASNDRNRMEMALELDGVHWFLESLAFYGRVYSEETDHFEDEGHHGTSGKEHAESDKEEEDDARPKVQQHQVMTPCVEVLVKLIRLIANVCINEQVALRFAQESKRLSWLVMILKLSWARDDEELMLNTVSCLTNLCYFCTIQGRHEEDDDEQPNKTDGSDREIKPKASFIFENRLEIATVLAKVLLHVNEEAIVEAARAFGNLSRFSDVLEYMQTAQVMNAFVVLLDHSNREIVCSVCGVLMNATLHQGIRKWLLEGLDLDGDTVFVCDLLGQIVHTGIEEDMDLALMACKVLYNLVCVGGTCKDSTTTTQRSHLDPHLASLRSTLEQVSKQLEAQGSRKQVGAADSRKEEEQEEQEVVVVEEEEEREDLYASAQEVASIATQVLQNLMPKRIAH